jgi:hypothetical protein
LREALEAQLRHIKSDWVFTNPETEEAWKDIRKVFRRACKAVKLTGVWFHDLRRSFVTNARRRGVPESVVMRMSGRRTRAVFDRYNIVEEDERDAVKRIEALQRVAKSCHGDGPDRCVGCRHSCRVAEQLTGTGNRDPRGKRVPPICAGLDDCPAGTIPEAGD